MWPQIILGQGDLITVLALLLTSDATLDQLLYLSEPYLLKWGLGGFKLVKHPVGKAWYQVSGSHSDCETFCYFVYI